MQVSSHKIHISITDESLQEYDQFRLRSHSCSRNNKKPHQCFYQTACLKLMISYEFKPLSPSLCWQYEEMVLPSTWPSARGSAVPPAQPSITVAHLSPWQKGRLDTQWLTGCRLEVLPRMLSSSAGQLQCSVADRFSFQYSHLPPWVRLRQLYFLVKTMVGLVDPSSEFMLL